LISIIQSTTAGFENINATIQVKRFALWAHAVSKDYIKEASFEIKPDNNELQKYLTNDIPNATFLPSQPFHQLQQAQTTTQAFLRDSEQGLTK
jgi:hypothetical protein